jgi:hypothetical protein
MAPNTSTSKTGGNSANASQVNITPTSSSDNKGKDVVVDTDDEDDKMDVDEDEPAPPIELKESVRISQPDKFSGDRKQLNSFLLQMEIYFSFNDDKFESYYAKSLFASSFLRGSAQDWIEPFITDFYENKATCGKMANTKAIFRGWDGFKTEIRKMFGDFDAVQIAVRKLLDHRQTGSAMNYSTEFQRYGAKTGWDAIALIELYKRGLKPHLREELARAGIVFPNLNTMIEAVVQLDNRLYEARRGNGHGKREDGGRRTDGGNQWKTPRNQNQEQSKQVYATQTRKPLSIEERTRRREKQLCYNCGQPGHQVATCPQNKNSKPWKGKTKRVNATQSKQIAMTRRVPVPEESQNPLSQDFGQSSVNETEYHSTNTLPLYTPEEKGKQVCNELDDNGDFDDLESIDNPELLPKEGELWTYLGPDTGGNLWKHSTGENRLWTAFHQTTGHKPQYNTQYTVSYTDPERIAFLNNEGQFVVEWFNLKQEMVELMDLIEVGEIWEIIKIVHDERIWRRAIFSKGQHYEYARQVFPLPQTNTLLLDTPYRLKEWSAHLRIWVDQYTDRRVVELLREPKEICATPGPGQIVIDMKLRGRDIKVMIDSGATGNFMSPKTLARINIPIRSIGAYLLQTVDGTNVNHNEGIINKATIPSKLRTDGHTSEVQFDIAPIGDTEAILGMPWIKEHNPEIDWVKRTLRFTRCHCEGSQR